MFDRYEISETKRAVHFSSFFPLLLRALLFFFAAREDGANTTRNNAICYYATDPATQSSFNFCDNVTTDVAHTVGTGGINIRAEYASEQKHFAATAPRYCVTRTERARTRERERKIDASLFNGYSPEREINIRLVSRRDAAALETALLSIFYAVVGAIDG